MRKYLEIASIYLKTQLAWKADAISSIIFTITKIIFAYLIWGIIFDGREMVSGFTFHSMLSYYIISSFLTQIDISGGISREISYKIRNGTFSKYMVIPVQIEKYFIAMEAGSICFYLVADFIAAVAWVFIFRIRFVITGSILLILSAVVMILLGLLFMIKLNFYLGILTLKYQEISTFLIIKDNLVSLITGSIIPLALLPDYVVGFMKIFPFYYITYLPSMLLIGRCGEEALRGIILLLVWCIGLDVISRKTYQKYRLKFDGVGI
jgi:ABC-type uncharacterized transport system, permease component